MNYSKEELYRLYKMSWKENGQFVEGGCSPWTLDSIIDDRICDIEKIAALKTGEALEVVHRNWAGEAHIRIEATDEIYDWEELERERERDRRTQAMEMAHNCESFNDYMGY